MKSGDYETISIWPGGAVYLFMRDRSLTDVKALAGKRIATMDYDQAAITMVDRAGASMVPADIGTFAGMFNNGGVDLCYAPATAFKPLELEKGLTQNGGIARFALAQLTLQMLTRTTSVSASFIESSRKFAATNFSKALKMIERLEKSVPSKYWIDLPPERLEKYDALLREVRIALKDKKIYDATMLRLLRKIRCKDNPSRAECAEKRE